MDFWVLGLGFGHILSFFWSFGDSDSPPPSSLLREKKCVSFFNEIQLYERDQLHQRGEPCDERTNERTNARRRKTRDVPFVAREVGGDARWFPSRRLVVVCFLFLFLRERIGNAKT